MEQEQKVCSRCGKKINNIDKKKNSVNEKHYPISLLKELEITPYIHYTEQEMLTNEIKVVFAYKEFETEYYLCEECSNEFRNFMKRKNL